MDPRIIASFPIDAQVHPDLQHGLDPSLRHCWYFPRLGDVDGDGALELCYFRGSSAQMCYRADGRRLWHHHDPKRPMSETRSDSLCPVGDFDGDGLAEALCVRWKWHFPHLCLADAATGEPRAWSERRLALRLPPHLETRCSLIPILLDGPGRPASFILHQDYARVTAFGPDLRERWHHDIPELGHNSIPLDADGSGRESLFTGTRLIGPGGDVRWARPELLDGTGEWHPDSNPAGDLDGDGRPELIVGAGAQILDLDGALIRRVRIPFTEIQSVRLLHTAAGTRIAWTDLPATGGPLSWRGFDMRDLRSVTWITDHRGEVLARIPGMHTPSVADWDGDGDDELVLLGPEGTELLILRPDGRIQERIPIQPRVYISDLAVGPILAGARGEQLVLHEWNPDFTQARVVILGDPAGQGRLRPRGPMALARWTPY